MAEPVLFHKNGERVRWNHGGKKSVLETYVKLSDQRLIGEHWLWCAVSRVANGEDITSVMNDYGYVYQERPLPSGGTGDA